MKTSLLFLSFLFAISSCSGSEANSSGDNINVSQKHTATAYFASGCFWCVEAIFESVKGVGDVVSGYAGGKASTAKYNLVSAGKTNHAESVAVHYDSTKIDYPTLLKVFFGSHDPSTLNQQGPDKGRQYRSAIFYQNQKEKQLAEDYIQELLHQNKFEKITTEVVPLKEFYAAEDNHQDYERKNPNNSYVKAVSIPRLNLFKSKFPELLKTQ